MLRTIVVTIAGLFALQANAQKPPASTDSASQRTADARLQQFLKQDSARSKGHAQRVDGSSPLDTASDAAFLAVPPHMTGARALDSATAVAYAAALRAYYDYRVTGLAHRRAVFEWQLFSSQIIFWIVIGLVVTGVAFSGIQFRAALEAARAARVHAVARFASTVPAASVPKDAISTPISLGLDSSVEASHDGIKVSSPVLGVIILALSLLFFYLYLNFVYPIQESI
ncbi:MAG TPA: hypothetical protein VGO46_14495 [Gemmatimonadaceae bacterium]|nr:hypothetical protein [Gemmatimonadaceae bacterium]